MSFIKKIFRCCILLFFVFITTKANCQITATPTTTDTTIATVQVRKILIFGNKKTKSYIISRETQINEGDSLSILIIRKIQGDSICTIIESKVLEDARRNVYNTTLFNEVKISADQLSHHRIDIIIDVKERWYVFPIPQFQLVDRNISDWINNHNADFSRVNYGLKFTHYNLTGRRDQLKFTILNGFTRLLSFSYNQPYSNKVLTEGFTLGTTFSQAREIAYKTFYDNKIDFSYHPGIFVSTLYQAIGGYSIRKGIKNKQQINISYSNLKVPDTILTAKYNPHYFNSASSHQHILDISYTLQYVDVDNVAYPLKGNNYTLTASKRGIKLKGGTNMFSVEGSYGTYRDLTRNWYFSFQSAAKIKLPFEQPYVNQRGLGYGEVLLRGMENYVVDGVAYTVAKSTLKKKLVSFNIKLPLKSKTFNKIPFTIFAKTYADVGYAYNKKEYDTYFNNKFLYSGGFGIDLLSLYDLTLRLEYSFNQLGENGLFLKAQSGF